MMFSLSAAWGDQENTFKRKFHRNHSKEWSAWIRLVRSVVPYLPPPWRSSTRKLTMHQVDFFSELSAFACDRLLRQQRWSRSAARSKGSQQRSHPAKILQKTKQHSIGLGDAVNKNTTFFSPRKINWVIVIVAAVRQNKKDSIQFLSGLFCLYWW